MVLTTLFHRKFASIVGMAFVVFAHDTAGQARIESVLVTGTYAAQSPLTASHATLEAADIEQLNKRSVADLLRTFPGVLVEEQGGPGGLTAISIRGGEANFTVILLDGVALNDPTNTRGGGFDMANLNALLAANMIARIDVVRGAQSAVYGSDALAGVINIVTRGHGGEQSSEQSSEHSQTIDVEWGEDDYAAFSFGALGTLGTVGSAGTFDYALALGLRDEGTPVRGSERESESAYLKLGWQPNAQQRFVASLRHLEHERTSYPEQSGGPRLALLDDLDRGEGDDRLYAAAWIAQFTAHWNSRFSISRFDHEETVTSPGIPPYFEVPPNAAETRYRRDDVQWINSLSIAENTQLNVGGSYRNEDGDSEGYVEFFGEQNPTDFSLQRATTSVFASASITPTENWLLQGSLRHDDPEEFSAQTSWQTGLRYAPTSGIDFYANLGKAYKLPSFFALGHPLVGNSELEPEQARSWDIGLAWQVENRLDVEASYFFNDFEDLIDFDDATFRNVNRSQVETSGVELAVLWRPIDSASLRAHGTYTDIEVVGEDSVLTGRPQWKAGIAGNWHWDESLSATMDYQYTGKQWSVTRHSGQEELRELPDFHRVDIAVLKSLNASWQLRFSLDNVLDEDYETAVGFSAPGRAARIGLRFTP